MSNMYPSRFSRSSRWLKHQFVNDALERPLQIPELNELYDLMDDRFKQLGEAFFRNGDIKKGLAIAINRDTEGVPVSLTVSAGQIWVNGLAYDVAGAVLDEQDGLDAAAPEIAVGVTVTESTLTEITEASYKDPVANTDNYGMPGAHRLVYQTAIVLNDPTAYKIGTLRFGELVNRHESSQLSELNVQLARRTFDAMGHFTLEGFAVTATDTESHYLDTFKAGALTALAATVGITRGQSQTDSDLRQVLLDETVLITVDSGIAYPLGYRVDRVSAQRTLIRRAKDTRSRSNDAYNADDLSILSTSLGTRKLTLSHREGPVANVTRVSAVLRSEFVQVTRGNGLTDPLYTSGRTLHGSKAIDSVRLQNNFNQAPLANTPVTTPGGSVSRYRYDIIADQPSIVWANAASAPVAAGETYWVTLNYDAVLSQGTDYTLSSNDLHLPQADSLVLASGVGSVLFVDYTWFLDRIDVVGLDRNGDNVVIQGQSAQNPVPPGVPDNILPLSYIRLNANDGAGTILQTTVDTRRLSTLDLRNLLNEMDRLRYEQALTNLNASARITAQSGGLQPTSYLVDPAMNLDRIDFGDDELVKTPCAVNPTGWITAAELRQGHALTYDNSRSTVTVLANTASLGYTRQLTRNQPYASEKLVLNPGGRITQLPTIAISPDSDAEATIDPARSIPVINTLKGSKHPVPAKMIGGLLSPAVMGSANTKRILETLDDTMRPQTLTITGRGFAPLTDNLILRIHDVPMTSFTLISGTAGTTTGSVKTDSSGAFKLTATLPTGVPVGVREVSVSNGVVGAKALYRGVTTVGVALGQTSSPDARYTAADEVDPVAMAFQFAGPTPVHGVALYFADVDTAAHDVLVEVRETVAGVPTRTVVARGVISAAALVGKASSTAAIATDVTFERPFMAQAGKVYAMTVKTTSSVTSLWVAQTGDTDITAGDARVVPSFMDQPNFGALFYSPGQLAWQTDFSRRIRMGLYTASYGNNQVLQFEPLGVIPGMGSTSGNTPLATNAFKLALPLASVPETTQLVWEYSTDNATWQNFDPAEPQVLPGKTTGLILKATFSRADGTPSQSPLQPLGVPTLITLQAPLNPDNSGTYRFVYTTVEVGNLPTSVNRLKLQCDVPASLGSGSHLAVQAGYRDTNGQLKWLTKVAALTTATVLGNGLKTVRFPEITLPAVSPSYKIRLIGSTADTNPASLPKVTNLMAIAYTA